MVIIGNRYSKSTFGANSLKMLTISKFKHHPHCLFAWNIVGPAQYLQQLEGRTYSCIFQRTLSETEFKLNKKVSFITYSLHLTLTFVKGQTPTWYPAAWSLGAKASASRCCHSAPPQRPPCVQNLLFGDTSCVQHLLFRDLPACNTCFSETSLCARPFYQRPACVQNLHIRDLPVCNTCFSETSLCARPAYQRHVCVQNLPIRDLPVCNPWLSETSLCSKPAIHRPACM